MLKQTTTGKSLAISIADRVIFNILSSFKWSRKNKNYMTKTSQKKNT